jgi:formylglycine-generating enzyme required for sulfatase activity
VGIEWANAVSYCEWVGGRLPSEAEWEFAAKSDKSFIYPWGNIFNGSLVNYCDSNCTRAWQDNSFDDGLAFTAPVGSYSPEGDSWIGAADLVGNVWEWTSDWYSNYPGVTETGNFRVLRGGSWISITQGVRTTNRSDNEPEIPLSSIGFRCVVDISDS